MATFILVTGCNNKNDTNSDNNQTNGHPLTLFPSELVDFIPIEQNPVFQGTGTDTWDRNIRERGYILKEDDIYKMWYTGFDDSEDPIMHLGYATSDDGIHWTRYTGNAIYNEYWTEDVQVVKHDGTYYIVAEGVDDIAHMLTSINYIFDPHFGFIYHRTSEHLLTTLFISSPVAVYQTYSQINHTKQTDLPHLMKQYLSYCRWLAQVF